MDYYIAYILYTSFCEILHISWSIFCTFLHKLYSSLILKTPILYIFLKNIIILLIIYYVFFYFLFMFLTLQYFLFIYFFLLLYLYCYAPNTKANSFYVKTHLAINLILILMMLVKISGIAYLLLWEIFTLKIEIHFVKSLGLIFIDVRIILGMFAFIWQSTVKRQTGNNRRGRQVCVSGQNQTGDVVVECDVL